MQRKVATGGLVLYLTEVHRWNVIPLHLEQYMVTKSGGLNGLRSLIVPWCGLSLLLILPRHDHMSLEVRKLADVVEGRKSLAYRRSSLGVLPGGPRHFDVDL